MASNDETQQTFIKSALSKSNRKRGCVSVYELLRCDRPVLGTSAVVFVLIVAEHTIIVSLESVRKSNSKIADFLRLSHSSCNTLPLTTLRSAQTQDIDLPSPSRNTVT